MTACYIGEGLEQRRASFELFVRQLPTGFGYWCNGAAAALDYLESSVSAQLSWLLCRRLAFCEHSRPVLADASPDAFTGVLGGAGTAIFAGEPLLRVEAPLQAQLVETYLLNTLNYQTLVATRAARIRDVAGPTATAGIWDTTGV